MGGMAAGRSASSAQVKKGYHKSVRGHRIQDSVASLVL
jgi:hypothetical protein